MRNIQMLAILPGILALLILREERLVSASVRLQQQPRGVDPIYDLLQLPAPPPNRREASLKEGSTENIAIDPQRNPPGDDAPLEVLIGYWTGGSFRRDGKKLSPIVRKRFL